ncbi:MAG TPA: pyruvate, phosphate dikinase [Candidatus Nitrosotalea sp.]|nr:pyruvate, phosphate dikinase [Candidatus Nitrosotalea sp.]
MKSVYFFNEGSGKNKRLFGGKGAGLMEMTKLGLPVPPGFTITTEVCTKYYAGGKKLPKNLMKDVIRNMARIERRTGKKFGSEKNPLLVSVRSGAAISMPGMMDTILNLGLNDKTVLGLGNSSKNTRFAWDSYRRFVQIFGKVVFGIDDKKFDDVLQDEKKKQQVSHDYQLDEESLRRVVSEYKRTFSDNTGLKFPEDPYQQLESAIAAVFKSWMGERAVVYREKYKITEDMANGTAVNVVAMVFGNMGDDSVTGVVFTRDPSNGSKKVFGEYLKNAQGEDVVAGIRTPQQISQMAKELPAAYRELLKVCDMLERNFKEPQDIEFTVERGKFYLLQTRAAKMNASAMISTSVSMAREKMITKKQAVLRIHPEDLDQMLHKTIDENAARRITPITRGIPASPGAASGVVVFDVKKAVVEGEGGMQVILVREETKPEDVPGFFSSAGILTCRGGKTSHAAVVARGMGKPCIVGCSDIKIDYGAKKILVDGKTVSEGETITIDGSTGSVYVGKIPTIDPKLTGDFRTILEWAEKFKNLEVRANVDTPYAAKLARTFGAKGVGLCRTERMFNAKDRLSIFVDMIMARDSEARKGFLKQLHELQKHDFKEILSIMEGYPVTIRLLDPPLHEFLPNIETLLNRAHALEERGDRYEISHVEKILQRAKELAETNPMMGHRGVRLGITFPEIYEMQMRAICEAAAELKKSGVCVCPQIMIPQVGNVAELEYVRNIYRTVKAEIETKWKVRLRISFGTMMEVVRACLTADEIAQVAEFFSFGTNDLTQAVFSFSREDAEEKFLPQYFEKNIIAVNPFQSLDINGVGSLMKIAILKGRNTRPDLEIGVCGEHGGDPLSIKFCDNVGLSYVSASAHRVPIAILSAAQASLESKNPANRFKRDR